MKRFLWTTLPLLFVTVGLAGAQTDRGPISGKIVKATNQPVLDAIIKFTLERSPTGFRRTTKSRPPDGRFSDEMPQGWVLIAVFKKEEDGTIWVGKERVKVDTNFGAVIPQIRLTQQKGGGDAGALPAGGESLQAIVQGTVFYQGSPVAGHVLVSDIETGDDVASAQLTADGKYSLVLETNRDYLFTAMAEEEIATNVVVNLNADSQVDIRLN